MRPPCSAILGHWYMVGRRRVETRPKMKARLLKRSGDANTLSAPASAAFAASMALAISSRTATSWIERSTPRACAASSSARTRDDVVVLLSTSAAIRRTPGTASMRISCRLPSSSEARRVTPVIFPPGWPSERAKPWPTISSVKARIGMLVVACWAARTEASPPARITSTRAFTRSAACARVKERRRIWVEEICDARDVWRDPFHQFEPLTGYRGLEIREPGEIAAGSRQALHHAGGERVADLDKHRGRRAGGILDRDGDGRRIGQDHVRPQIEQFFGELARMHDVARTPAIDELDIAALDPAERVKGLLENHDPRLSFRVIRDSHQHAHPPHAIRLLRARRERPSRSAAQKDHELTPLHSDMGLPPARPGSDHNPP